MNATATQAYAGIQEALQTDRWVDRLSAGTRDWLRSLRYLHGRFGTKSTVKQPWTTADQDAVMEEVVKAQPDFEVLVQESIVLTVAEAESILSHIACGNDVAIGKIVRLHLQREFYPRLLNVVDEA